MASFCRECGEKIYWDKNKNKKWIPLDNDGTLHFKTCGDKGLDPQVKKESYRLNREFERKIT